MEPSIHRRRISLLVDREFFCVLDHLCFLLFTAWHLFLLISRERVTRNHQSNEIPEAALSLLELGEDLVRGGAISYFQFPAKRVSEELLSQAAIELWREIHHEFSEFRNV